MWWNASVRAALNDSRQIPCDTQENSAIIDAAGMGLQGRVGPGTSANGEGVDGNARIHAGKSLAYQSDAYQVHVIFCTYIKEAASWSARSCGARRATYGAEHDR